MEALEDRCTPTVIVRFDNSMDTSGLFSRPEVQAALQRAAADVTAQIGDQLDALIPSGGNTLTGSVINGLTGQLVTIGNLKVNANEIVVYVVGGNLDNSELGLASGGAYSAQGSSSWLTTVRTRGQSGVDAGTDYATWGGMIAFSGAANWNFSPNAPSASQFDFQSVATHELMHIFGFGLNNPSFTRWVGSGRFTGPNAAAVFGATVPMQPGTDTDHFAQGTSSGGQVDVMSPAITAGATRRMTALDYAALRDIGWSAAPASPPPAVTAPPPTTTGTGTSLLQATTAVPPTDAGTTKKTSYAIGSGASVTGFNGSGQQVLNATQLGANYAGGTRVAVGDFNGDGTPDYAAAAGPGAQPEVKVFDGASGQLLADFMAYEWYFTGGVYVAAGDVMGNGRAELVVGAGAGGGPRVRVIDVTTSTAIADFWGIADENFRGGVRPAVGDIDKDGRADLVCAAGETGGPRVAVYDGRSFGTNGVPTRLAPDFYAFEPSLTNGAYVATGDVNGDGYADLICGSGEGGGPRVVVYDGAALKAGRVIQVASFMAGDPFGSSGVRVAAADIDGDGLADIVTGSGPNSDGVVRVYTGSSLTHSSVASQLKQYAAGSWAVNGAFVG